MASIKEKLLNLPGETDVIPGHGQPTTIAREGMSNPFLEPFNEPMEE
jgi:glyoxylase-like metal-dependent hydrolase (beta-lactamase superfamily II)